MRNNKKKFLLTFILVAILAASAIVVLSHTSEDCDAATSDYVYNIGTYLPTPPEIAWDQQVLFPLPQSHYVGSYFYLYSMGNYSGPPAWIQKTSDGNYRTTSDRPVGQINVDYVQTVTNNGNFVSQGVLHQTFIFQGQVSFNFEGGSNGTPGGNQDPIPTISTVILPNAQKTNANFAGWYTASVGGTRVGGSGDTWTPTKSIITLYAQYTDTLVLFKIAGIATTVTAYSLPYNGAMQLQFQVVPASATVTMGTNTTGANITAVNINGTVTVSGSVKNVLPSIYDIFINATSPGYTDGNFHIQLSIDTAILEPLTDTVYLGTTYGYQITTIPSSAQIASADSGLNTVTNAQGQAYTPNVDYTWFISGRSIQFQPLKVGVFYIDLWVAANGYTPAIKQIILNAVPQSDIQGAPSASGITAVRNEQVDGGWFFTVDNPQNYHMITWDFGDQSASASGVNVTHQYEMNGSFYVTCTLTNKTTGQTYPVSTTITVSLQQQIMNNAWVDTPYTFSLAVPGTDTVTMTTDIDQGWLSIDTYTDNDVRMAKIYSDIGPPSGLEDTDLTVTVYNGAVSVMTYTIHIWAKVDTSIPANFGFNLSAVGMTVTVNDSSTSTGYTYLIVTWGDGYSNQDITHTYTTPGFYAVSVDYMANGGSIATRHNSITVPSNSEAHSIYYDANGGSGSIPPSYGQSIAVAGNEFVRDGYSFSYWNTAPDGSGTTFVPGALANGLNADVTLYAIWASGGNHGGGSGTPNKLTEKYLGIPLWVWIVILIIILLLAVIFLAEAL